MIRRFQNPWNISLILHFSFIVGFYILSHFKVGETDLVEVPIIESEPIKEIQNIAKINEKPKVFLKSVNDPKTESSLPKREVFGSSRNSYTDESLGEEGVNAKKGNTLAKEVDESVLQKDDVDSFPTPTEEYLVSEMPQVVSEVRPNYPKEAREKGVEGSVVMDVLIDDKGKVRQVTVIEGEGIFRQGAIEAMKKFLFRPAKVDGKPVAVKIRYSLKFLLEY